MHLKFLDRGTGSAAVAAAYLLAVKDAAGKVRAAVEVLRGDPKLVAAVADGLPFKHKYTSGVCAWSAEDAPTRPQIERFVDEFERTAWSGLDPERYAWSVVVHRDDDGGVHLHTFSARCDLATGLSLNIAPPGWQETFDPLRDAFNYAYGWSRPDDPARARPSRPAPGRVHRDRAARRAREDVEPDPREEIGKHLLGLVAAGTVKDRAGVVVSLQECGYEVPRQGQHYVTARNPETGERWRLRGALYERDFERERFMREAPERSGDRERADGGDDASSAAAKAWEAVEEDRRRRAEYHRKHYGRGSRTSGDQVQDAGSGGGGDVERESGSAAAPAAGHDASLAAHLQRELGEDAQWLP